MKLYIKKIWSLSPTKYRHEPLEKMLKAYYEYCIAVMTSDYQDEFMLKTFEQWRTTEI